MEDAGDVWRRNYDYKRFYALFITRQELACLFPALIKLIFEAFRVIVLFKLNCFHLMRILLFCLTDYIYFNINKQGVGSGIQN